MYLHKEVFQDDADFQSATPSGQKSCGLEFKGWICTRSRIHIGKHAAHGCGVQFASWDDVDMSNVTAVYNDLDDEPYK